MESQQASNERLTGASARAKAMRPRAKAWLLRAAAMAACAAGLAACGGGGGGGGGGLPIGLPPVATPAPAPAPAPVASTQNSMTVTVDRGTGSSGVNLPQVSVQLCAPGTSNCQTINNVLIDTGSTGLRITAAAINPSLLAALPRESVNSAPLNACQQFLDGYTWGTMRVADVTLGPKSAAAQPLQIVGDTAAGGAPVTCSANGTLAAEHTPAPP